MSSTIEDIKEHENPESTLLKLSPIDPKASRSICCCDPDSDMDTYLDPINRKFADAAAEGPPLYTKTYQEARDILEGIQSYKTASDIKTEEIKVPVNGEDVTTVIFRPTSAQGTLNMIFYTHGGGWILGRLVNHQRAMITC
jgi:acetyl esterase/lipase